MEHTEEQKQALNHARATVTEAPSALTGTTIAAEWWYAIVLHALRDVAEAFPGRPRLRGTGEWE